MRKKTSATVISPPFKRSNINQNTDRGANGRVGGNIAIFFCENIDRGNMVAGEPLPQTLYYFDPPMPKAITVSRDSVINGTGPDIYMTLIILGRGRVAQRVGGGVAPVGVSILVNQPDADQYPQEPFKRRGGYRDVESAKIAVYLSQVSPLASLSVHPKRVDHPQKRDADSNPVCDAGRYRLLYPEIFNSVFQIRTSLFC